MGLSAARLSRFAVVVLLLCLCAPFCKPEPDGDVPIDPLPGLPSRSLRCFDDGQVYSCCEGAYRLNPSGVIAVPPGEVDSYCGGACVVETEDVLNCVASALDGFRFFNGASVEDARYALRRGCSHTIKRGSSRAAPPCMCLPLICLSSRVSLCFSWLFSRRGLQRLGAADGRLPGHLRRQQQRRRRGQRRFAAFARVSWRRRRRRMAAALWSLSRLHRRP
jgi:hypothetical protein